MAGSDSPIEQTEKSLVQKARAWGESSFPPTLLASLITGLHGRPFQALPMLFPPILLFTSYANLQGFKTETAGISAAWSGLYLLLANRRKQVFKNKWGPGGIVRGAAMGLSFVNLVCGGLAYTLGKRDEEED
ncbi:hypothetical protein BO70DRAFT_360989 [Aspergillus heteromorphus CBS 117.55]|uniref:Altered inheritance of mitochondria protein 19 n=1 Tax=Aspergillus heteromorphus CBS 117.55 TaxID=1448321 RepID=A0A317WKF9_9EURO|nr:uncharacterized protein BO70DRAFT_360989 [Aspergillus heteromorphus CBS 117.55]PWY86171.1 hypothetical protein BO70DRAFT_360989 [Aspergillus heteromorphus CBS 117.55]